MLCRTQLNSLSERKSWQDPYEHFIQVLENPWYALIAKLNSHLTYQTTSFFKSQGFSSVLLPITCSSVSSPMGLGSDSLPVSVNLFGQKTYLADSMQFQLEYLLRIQREGVWYIMPTFRGEDPDERHLNQFFHVEAEFVGELDDAIYLVNNYLKFLVTSITESPELLANIEKIVGDTSHLFKFCQNYSQIPIVPFEKARGILGEKEAFYQTVAPGLQTISPLGEQHLLERYDGALWLTHLPEKSVPFYQALAPHTEYALCADLILGIGETVGLGQRHATYEETLASLHRHQVDSADYEWYLNMKKLYPLTTSGFGLGLERFLLWILKHHDIRDMHLLSRLKGYSAMP